MRDVIGKCVLCCLVGSRVVATPAVDVVVVLLPTYPLKKLTTAMDVAASLKSWEDKQRAAKTAAASVSKNSSQVESATTTRNSDADDTERRRLVAVTLREKGNAAFKKGALAEADTFYTQSLETFETLEALANRALVKLKLGKLEEAETDCNRVLKLEPNHVKALLRRGTVRNLMGLSSLALEDFLRAERLEPANKTIRDERLRTETLLEMAKHDIVSSNATVKRGEPETKSAPVEKNKKKKKDKALAVQEVVEEEEEEGHRSSAASFSLTPTNAVKEDEDGKKRSVAAMNGARAVNQRAADATIQSLTAKLRLPDVPPRTNYAFTKLWNDLHGREDLRRSLLCDLMSDADLRACFETNLEPDVLMDIVRALRIEENDSASGRRVVDLIRNLPSFSLARMFLSEEDLEAMERV